MPDTLFALGTNQWSRKRGQSGNVTAMSWNNWNAATPAQWPVFLGLQRYLMRHAGRAPDKLYQF